MGFRVIEGEKMYELIFAFVVGISIGSFLNVCIYRIPNKLTVVCSVSRCGDCGERIKLGDMMPVLSYWINGGKCKYCKSSYSIRYMWVELLTGVLFLIPVLDGQTFTDLVFQWLFMSILIVISFIDIDEMIIPNKLLVGLAMLAVVQLALKKIMWKDSLMGIGLGLAVIVTISLLGKLLYRSSEVMGAGDWKYIIILSMLLGLQKTGLMLYLAVILCGVIGIYFMVSKQSRKIKLPFGPFLSMGSLIAYYYSDSIISILFSGV